jgi:hypothetical protein
MPPENRPPPEPPPYEAFEALAAGELPPAEARALEARIQAESGWAGAYAEVREVERLLREETLLPLPLPLVQRVLADVLPTTRERPLRVLARAAAAILVFFASWLAFSGDVPALANIGPRTEVAAVLPEVLAAAPEGRLPPELAVAAEGTGAALGLAAGGLVLIVLGVALSVRWHRRAARPKESTR